MYFTHKLSIVDANTISAPAGEVTYIPLPPPSNETFLGLISLDLPRGIRRGQEFGVIFKQLTNGFARYNTPRERAPEIFKTKGSKPPQHLLLVVQDRGDAKPAIDINTSTSIVTENRHVSFRLLHAL
jgi:hypothetical protein